MTEIVLLVLKDY